MPMKNRRRRVAPTLAKSDINITPLIDVLLVLLVIFMVITPVTPTGLDTAIPQPAPHGEPRTPEQVIVLSVDREGAIRINQERLELSALMPRLVTIFKNRSDRTVFVQADTNLDFNQVAQVIDVAKGAGVDRVGLLTAGIYAR